MNKNLKMHINYRGFWSMLALMFGFTIFSASVMSGGQIADKMSIGSGAAAIIIGNLYLALYGGVNAYIARKSSQNLDGVLKMAFGKNGAVIPSMVMVVTQIGWFAVGIGMIAIPIAKELGINPYALVFPIALFIITTAFFGIKSLTRLSLVAVPLVMVLGFTTIGIASSDNVISEVATTKFGIWAGLSLVIATFISGATFVPNFAVNANSTKNAVVSTALAFFVGNGLMITFGFMGGLFYDDTMIDFVSIAKKQGFMLVGLIILILNIWTTNDSGLYSISLGFKNWLNLPKRAGVVIFGLIGAGSSIFLFNNFINFLTMLNSFVPAVGAIIMTSFVFKRNERAFSKWGVDFMMIAIWALASGLTFVPVLKPFAPLASFATGFLISAFAILLSNLIIKIKTVKTK